MAEAMNRCVFFMADLLDLGLWDPWAHVDAGIGHGEAAAGFAARMRTAAAPG